MTSKYTKAMKEKGQTSVEYTLMLVVVVLLATSVFKLFKGYLVENPDSFINSYISSFESISGSDQGSFKRFSLLR